MIVYRQFHQKYSADTSIYSKLLFKLKITSIFSRCTGVACMLQESCHLEEFLYSALLLLLLLLLLLPLQLFALSPLVHHFLYNPLSVRSLIVKKKKKTYYRSIRILHCIYFCLHESTCFIHKFWVVREASRTRSSCIIVLLNK